MPRPGLSPKRKLAWVPLDPAEVIKSKRRAKQASYTPVWTCRVEPGTAMTRYLKGK